MVTMTASGKDRQKLEPCAVTGKQRLTKIQARKMRMAILRKRGKTNGRTNVYRCDWCDHWHTGRR